MTYMKRIMLLISGCLIIFAPVYGVDAGRKEASRTEESSLPAGKAKKIVFDTEFGNLVVNEWNRNEFSVTANITVTADSYEDAKYAADNIQIKISQSGDMLNYETRMPKTNKQNLNYNIKYVANIPANMEVGVTHKYGHVQLPDMSKNFYGDVSYGNLTTGMLGGGNNVVNMKYGNLYVNGDMKGADNVMNVAYGNVDMGDVTSLTLNLKYGNFNAGDAGVLKANTRYSKLRLGKVGKIDCPDSKYDSYDIRSLNTFHCSSSTSTFNVGEVLDVFVLKDVKYGAIKIGRVGKDFTLIDIGASYLNVNLAFTEPLSFDFNLYAEYGQIDPGPLAPHVKTSADDFKFQQRDGRIGDGKAKVRIKVKYGGINIR